MKVNQIMMSNVATCRPDDNLAVVAKLMWDNDCGFVPVIDAAGRVSGVITDRDICIAAATRRLLPEHISAAQAMTHSPIQTALPDEPVEKALDAMKQFRVRRLPVVANDGTVKGVISMNDIVLASQEKGGPNPAAVTSALASICTHRVQQIIAA